MIDQLYFFIQSEGVNKWISKYPRVKSGVANPNAEFEQVWNLCYNQYKSIILRLNDIFEIEKEINYKEDGVSRKSSHFVSIFKLVNDSHKWMQGQSIGFSR
ncbi:hypothetical protein [Enterobacter cloacae complex sp. 358K9]|uniref:hypothetical protein n=1 Tax=Enterobacter cloacae complex sp. 358K9 TaxID=3395826 RepID=UPI003CED04C7